MIYLFTGEGKGKTSAALGVVCRFLCLGKRVLWVSWYKCRNWQISEMGLEDKYPKILKMIWAGSGFYIKDGTTKMVNGAMVHDFDTQEGHQKAAEEAMGITEDTSGEYDLVVMDEVVNAIGDGLLSEKRVLDFLKDHKGYLILTGRGASQKLIDQCDLVSVINKIKHPFDKGELAVRGMDF